MPQVKTSKQQYYMCIKQHWFHIEGSRAPIGLFQTHLTCRLRERYWKINISAIDGSNFNQIMDGLDFYALRFDPSHSRHRIDRSVSARQHPRAYGPLVEVCDSVGFLNNHHELPPLGINWSYRFTFFFFSRLFHFTSTHSHFISYRLFF